MLILALRAGAFAVTMLFAATIFPARAAAVGGAVCSNQGCAGSAGTPGSPGGASSGGSSSGGGGNSPCTYRPADLSAAMTAGLGGQPSGAVAWYVKTCFSPDGNVVLE